MAELKTQKNNASVTAFLENVEPEQKSRDCLELLKVFKEVTKEEVAMWGTSIVGFGSYHYKSERSRQEGDWPLTGFAPRKQNITIYIMPGFGTYQDLLAQLGPHKTGGSCLYIKRLSDVKIEVLKKLIKTSVQDMKKKYLP